MPTRISSNVPVCRLQNEEILSKYVPLFSFFFFKLNQSKINKSPSSLTEFKTPSDSRVYPSSTLASLLSASPSFSFSLQEKHIWQRNGQELRCLGFQNKTSDVWLFKIKPDKSFIFTVLTNKPVQMTPKLSLKSNQRAGGTSNHVKRKTDGII